MRKASAEERAVQTQQVSIDLGYRNIVTDMICLIVSGLEHATSAAIDNTRFGYERERTLMTRLHDVPAQDRNDKHHARTTAYKSVPFHEIHRCRLQHRRLVGRTGKSLLFTLGTTAKLRSASGKVPEGDA